MPCFIVCIVFMFYVFVLSVFPCIIMLYCIDVRLSHLNKNYLFTYMEYFDSEYEQVLQSQFTPL